MAFVDASTDARQAVSSVDNPWFPSFSRSTGPRWMEDHGHLGSPEFPKDAIAKEGRGDLYTHSSHFAMGVTLVVHVVLPLLLSGARKDYTRPTSASQSTPLRRTV